MVVAKDRTIFRFSSTSAMFLLSPFNPIRRIAIFVLTHPYPFNLLALPVAEIRRSKKIRASSKRLFVGVLPVFYLSNTLWTLLPLIMSLLTGILKPQINGPLYNNTVISTLAVDGWAVTFGTARRGLGGLRPAQSPPRCTKCSSPPINGQCTNFILFDVAV